MDGNTSHASRCYYCRHPECAFIVQTAVRNATCRKDCVQPSGLTVQFMSNQDVHMLSLLELVAKEHQRNDSISREALYSYEFMLIMLTMKAHYRFAHQRLRS